MVLGPGLDAAGLFSLRVVPFERRLVGLQIVQELFDGEIVGIEQRFELVELLEHGFTLGVVGAQPIEEGREEFNHGGAFHGRQLRH